MLGLLHTAIGLVLIPTALVITCLCMLLAALLGATPERIHRWLYVGFARFAMAVAGTRLRLRGAEHVQPDTAYVVVPNHDSSWDPVLLVYGLPKLLLRFVAKHELMRIPILGQALRATGNVEVMRHHDRGDANRIQSVMGERHPEVSILFFAEGARSRDGAMSRFKMGAFATAIGYGLPILPIGLAGSRQVLEPLKARLRRGTVAVEVGEPIPTEGYTLERREELRSRCFEAVKALRARARQRLRDEGIDPGGVD